uniref:Uncharacterized protein n=1 Tax=Arundo donax TaxID=35708 RepID=A0A0A8YIK5_ARUDO
MLRKNHSFSALSRWFTWISD